MRKVLKAGAALFSGLLLLGTPSLAYAHEPEPLQDPDTFANINCVVGGGDFNLNRVAADGSGSGYVAGQQIDVTYIVDEDGERLDSDSTTVTADSTGSWSAPTNNYNVSGGVTYTLTVTTSTTGGSPIDSARSACTMETQ